MHKQGGEIRYGWRACSLQTALLSSKRVLLQDIEDQHVLFSQTLMIATYL